MADEIGGLQDLLDWLSKAPKGALLPAEGIQEMLSAASGPQEAAQPAATTVAETWRERLWTVPPETRLGVPELAESLGRSRSWVYRHTGLRSDLAPIPHRKLEGELVFVVQEIRDWLALHEVPLHPPREAWPWPARATQRVVARQGPLDPGGRGDSG